MRLSKAALGPVVGALGLLAGCGGDDGITYYDDIRPIFAQRCTICHNANRPVGVNIAQPFAEDGLVGSDNNLYNDHCQDGGDRTGCSLPTKDLEPGNPDNSMLLKKVDWEATGTNGVVGHFPERCPLDAVGGSCMPLQIQPLVRKTYTDAGAQVPCTESDVDTRTECADDEIAIIRRWIKDGATANDARFTRVQQIFGDQDDKEAGPGKNLDNDGIDGAGKCSYCHYQGTPNPPELSAPGMNATNVFKPVVGIVNVKSKFQPRLLRVAAGDPDASFLVKKVEATEPQGGVGAPMPYSFNPLDAQQIEVVRQWIQEGAQNN